jgi:hypothetical protein
MMASPGFDSFFAETLSEIDTRRSRGHTAILSDSRSEMTTASASVNASEAIAGMIFLPPSTTRACAIRAPSSRQRIAMRAARPINSALLQTDPR